MSKSGKTKSGKGKGKGKTFIGDSILGVTDPALKRLAHRAGVKRIGGKVYDLLRKIIKFTLEDVLRDSITITEHHRKKTVGTSEVKEALSLRNVNILYYEKKVPKVITNEKKEGEEEGEIKKKKSHNKITFDAYIYKVLKQVHPNMGINSSAKSQLNQYLMVLIKYLNNKGRSLADMNEKKTLTSREVQSSVRLLFPGELSKHAVSEGTKAITKFNASMYGGIKGDKGSKTKASRAGLTFAPSRIEKMLRGVTKLNSEFSIKMRIGSGAPVYMAAVVEYLVAEILELSGNSAKDNNRVRITTRNLFLAIYNDDELESLSNKMGILFAKGGVMPNIHTSLLPKKQQKTIEENKLY